MSILSLIRGRFSRSAVRSRRRGAAATAGGAAFFVQWLEARRLLAVGPLPSSVDPAAAVQIAFAPGVSQQVIPLATPGSDRRLFEFSLDGPGFSDAAEFRVGPALPTAASDAALALYDDGGNLLASVDAGAAANPGAETLSATIQSGRPYILGVFFAPAGPPVNYVLSATTAPQALNAPLAINPATGAAHRDADGGEDAFDSRADVDYYPLDLLNGGAGGTVTVTPAGPDVKVFATLFRRDSSDEWRAIASGGGAGPVALALAPAPRVSLTDSQYLLAVAPLSLDAAAGAYKIDVAASPLLGPVSVDPSSPALVDLLTPPPESVGTAGTTRTGTLSVGGQSLFRFRAPATGTATLTLSSAAFQPVISVYDGTGGSLLKVASRLSPAGPLTVTVPLPVTAGTNYVVRVGDAGADAGGPFTLSIAQPYQPQNVSIGPSVTTLATVPVGASQPAQFFRLSPPFGTDVLALELTAGAGGPARLVVVGNNLPAVQKDVPAGQAAFIPLDVSSSFGPFDVYLAGAGADSTATLRGATFDVPLLLDLDALAPAQLDLAGDLSLPAQPTGAFGTRTGAAFYQPLTGGAATDLSAIAGNGARLLLAHYREDGNALRLVDYALPSDTGSAALSSTLSPDDFHGVAVFSLGFAGGTVATSVKGPDPLGVGVGMVPDLTLDPPQYGSILKISDVTLESESQQDLWRTILPYNIVAQPTVTLDPSGGDLGITLSIYWGDGPQAGAQIGPDVNTNPGQATTFTLPAAVADLKGRTLVFRVKARPNQLGDGIYTLRMNIATTDSLQYLINEPAWKFANTTPNYTAADKPTQDNPVGIIPQPSRGAAIVDIVQNQLGDGSAQGDFFNSTPGTDGSVDVYRFWAITRGPVVVRTVPIDPGVNTTLRLYRARFKPDGTLDYLGQIAEAAPSRDWYPADRSQIDAQTYINDFDTIDYDFGGDNLGHGPDADPYHTRGGQYFVVVKNEEGTQGRYRIEVDAPTFPPLGGTNPLPPDLNNDAYQRATQNQVAYISPTAGGAATLQMHFTEAFPEFLGYFPIQVPEAHDGTLTLSSASGSKWDFDVFDSSGARLTGSDTDTLLNTTGTFTVPAGPQLVYLRAKEQGADSNASANVTVSAALTFRAGTVFPPSALPASPAPALLLTNPLSDGSVSDAMTANGQAKAYAFRAASDVVTVNVMPATAGNLPDGAPDVRLRWGVYVDGVLRAWDETGVGITGALVPDSVTTTLSLPGLRPALDNAEFAYDRAPYHNVVVYVVAIQAPQNGGNFTVSVDSAATEPARDGYLGVDPRLYLSSATTTVAGVELTRLLVPEFYAVNDGLRLRVARAGVLPGTAFRYALYDMDGNLLSSQQLSTSRSDPTGVYFDLTAFAPGGNSYYLRAWEVGNALAVVTVTESATFPKAGFVTDNPKPQKEEDIGNTARADPEPGGEFILGFQGTSTTFAASFWVGTAGMVHVSADGQNLSNAYLALFRGGRVVDNEFDLERLFLVDYVNSVNKTADGQYAIDAWLDPGMYVARLVRTNTTSTVVFMNFVVQPYAAEEVVLDPNAGDNTAYAPLQGTDWPEREMVDSPKYEDGSIPLYTYRTKFYHAVAPVGSQSGMYVEAFSKSVASSGRAYLTVWDLTADGTFDGSHRYTQPDPSMTLPADTAAKVIPPVAAPPGHEFWIGLNRLDLASKVAVGTHFTVPMSGTPDLVVDPIVLTPNQGQTRVDLIIRNVGFAPAFTNHARFRYSDSSANPQTWTTSDQFEYGIAPLGQRDKHFDWPPKNPQDDVEYFTDVNHEIAELDETNNEQKRQLSEVDAHRPSVTLNLADPTLDGDPDPDVWGRYISSHAGSGKTRGGVTGVQTDILIAINDADGSQDLFSATGYMPYYNPPNNGGEQIFFVDAVPTSQLKFFDFGVLYPTTAQNPNRVHIVAKDRWGLPSVEVSKTAQVMRYPGWLDNDDSSMDWNPATKRYDIHFRNAVVDKGGTLDDLVGASVPFIGDKENRFLAEVKADTFATLDATQSVSAPVTAHVLIKVVGETLFEQTWSGNAQPTEHFEIESNVQVDPLTLDSTLLGVTFRLKDLDLFNYESPEIPLLAYGVPGVASINANVQFTLDVGLNGAVTVAIDPNFLQDPLLPPADIGLAAPTYIEPSIDAGAKIAGEVDLLGFDLAEISGSIHFKLNIAYGLTTPPSQWVDFEDFFSHAGLDITGEIYGNIAAEILGIEIFSFDTPSLDIDFSPGTDVTKDTGGGLASVAGGGAGVASVTPLPGDAEKIPGPDALVGNLRNDPRPNLVIDPVTGKAVYVQVLDVDPSAGVFNNLAFSRRGAFDGAWSPLQTLTDASHAANPLLALTHDQLGGSAPAVVAYQVMSLPGSPADKTRRAFLAGQDVGYRYFDGTNWLAPHTLDLPGYDTEHAMAFNAAGQGVVAWVNNTDLEVYDNPGGYARKNQEIRVARWNPIDHVFDAPQQLTVDAVADSKPAAYVDANGKMYVVWLRDTANGGNEIVFSTFDGASWSAPAALPVVGIPPGGKVGGLAIGSHTPGQIDVLFSHTRTLNDGPQGTRNTVESRLFNRQTTLAGFAQPATLEEVARDASFSTLRTTNAPDGSLVAYWQQNDGQVSDVFATRKAPAGGPWARPFQVTSGGDLEIKPSLAVDVVNGQQAYQVMYEAEVARGDTPAAPTLDAPVGAPAANGVGSSSMKLAPEFSFTKGIFFPFASDELTAGTHQAANAQIVNRGPSGGQVRVEFFSGPAGGSNPTKVGEQVVTLAAGSTLDLSQVFTILPGAADYSIRLTSLSGPEAVTTTDNLSRTTVSGKADLVIANITPSTQSPVGGQPVNFQVEVRNLGSVAVGQFPVAFLLGDPDVPATNPVQLGVTMVPGLGPNASIILNFGWTVPVGGGDFMLSAIADRSLTPIVWAPIDESVETNNDRQVMFRVRGDAGLGGPVTATIVNFSGVDNVNVQTTVRNRGKVTLINVRARLLWEVDGGGFIDQGTVIVPTLAPGATAPVSWLADGLAGTNRYRVQVDPDLQLGDTDPTNNVGEVSLILQGLPDLRVSGLALNPPAPRQGDPISVKALISNAGIAWARNVLVEVFATNATAGRILVGKMTLAELAPLSSRSVSIAIDTSRLVGETEISVVVDRLEKILETSELNNSVSARFNFQPAGIIKGRFVFYNRSAFDGNNPAATAADDNAIATDKTALLPGGTATFSNVTSYSRGINGIMVDMDLRGRTVGTADFAFRSGNDNNPGGWAAAVAPTVTIRRGAGAGGSDRVELIWADLAIRNTWLQVTVLANANTGLPTPDVFYFGNRIGESGDASRGSTLTVNAFDRAATLRNLSSSAVPVSNRFDFNRDGRVTSADVLTTRNNSRGVVLRLITATAATQSASATGRSAYAPLFGETMIGYRPTNRSRLLDASGLLN